VVVLSAHGVAPWVYENASDRNLEVIDATCPLVTKVHVEARRFVGEGRTIVLIGHAGHEEVEGTSGQAPERTILVQSPAEASTVHVPDPENLSFLT
jgi:4-hydroxy-3-methylbut-2-enyl diphosphate reductase